MHGPDVDEAVGVQALGVVGLAEERQILAAAAARAVASKWSLVQVGERARRRCRRRRPRRGSGRSTSGLGRGFGVFGHGLARAGRIELRIDEQRVARGLDAQGRGADQGQVHFRRLAQPLLESMSVSLREFYAPHYTVTDPAEGERLGRWRALGAANKAAHVAALCSGLSPGAVVEIGCGDGALLAALSERGIGSRLDGFEISPEAAELARLKDIPAGRSDRGLRRRADPRRRRRVRPGGALARRRARARARAAAARSGAAGAARDRRGAAGGQPLGAAAVGAGRGGADRPRARVRPARGAGAVRARRAGDRVGAHRPAVAGAPLVLRLGGRRRAGRRRSRRSCGGRRSARRRRTPSACSPCTTRALPPAVDVALLSASPTLGWRMADDAFAALVRDAGASCAVVRVSVGRAAFFKRHPALTDAVEALASRHSASRLPPARAVVVSTVTASASSSGFRVPYAVRFDAPAALNRPGWPGAWQRWIEPRALARAAVLLPWSEEAAVPGRRVIPLGVPIERVPGRGGARHRRFGLRGEPAQARARGARVRLGVAGLDGPAGRGRDLRRGGAGVAGPARRA